MKKWIIKAIVYSISVLFTKLVYDFIMSIAPIVKSTRNAYFDVLLGMVLTLCLFAPLYSVVFIVAEKISDFYIGVNKKMHKHSIKGLIIGFVFVLFLLFTGFLYLKFKINLYKDVYLWVGHLFHKKHS